MAAARSTKTKTAAPAKPRAAATPKAAESAAPADEIDEIAVKAERDEAHDAARVADIVDQHQSYADAIAKSDVYTKK
jgi:hypothetical protein